MKANNIPLIASLKEIKDSFDRSPTVFENDKGVIHVSAEDGGYFADYYGEFRGEFPWIHPSLIEWAKNRNMYWEWENPGCIGLYE